MSITDVIGPEVERSPFEGALPPVAADYTEFSFTSPRFILAQLAERAANVVPNRENFGLVLNNFAVEVSSEPRLQITGTDLELRVIASTPAVTVSLQAGQEGRALLMLPARRFLSILKEAPNGDVEVRVRGDRATITAGSASWELVLTSDGSDYPDPPNLAAAEWHDVPRLPLLAALKAVRYAVSKAGSRQNLGQVDIRPRQSDGLPCMTAADGTRFAQVPLPGFPVAMRIPAAGTPAATDELTRLLSSSESETIRVAAAPKQLFFGVDSTVFAASPLPLEYPDIWKLLLEPTLANTDELKAGRDDLRQAISRVRINSDVATSAIGLRLEAGQLTIFGRDDRGNRAQQAIGATWEHAERTLAVNHQFLAEMLNVHPSGECCFRLGKDAGKRRSPVLLHDEGSGVIGIINQMTISLAG